MSLQKDERQHWLTGTPDPSISIFKPFHFDIQEHLNLTKSPSAFPTKTKVPFLRVKYRIWTPIFFFQPEDRAHPLWQAHETIHTQVLHDVSKVPREELESQLIETPRKLHFDQVVQMEMDLYEKQQRKIQS